MDVLVLNAAYQPVNIVSWKDAFIKLYAEKAIERVEIVSCYKDRVVHSASVAHPMPSVVRHVKFRQMKKKGIKFSRDNIWARDHGKCQYCGQQVGRSTYTYDHVNPKSKGGKTVWENIVVACALCNGRKRDRTPEQANMRLKIQPFKPNSLPDEFKNTLRFREGMPEEWKVWFGAEYWHGGLDESSPEP